MFSKDESYHRKQKLDESWRPLLSNMTACDATFWLFNLAGALLENLQRYWKSCSEVLLQKKKGESQNIVIRVTGGISHCEAMLHSALVQLWQHSIVNLCFISSINNKYFITHCNIAVFTSIPTTLESCWLALGFGFQGILLPNWFRVQKNVKRETPKALAAIHPDPTLACGPSCLLHIFSLKSSKALVSCCSLF